MKLGNNNLTIFIFFFLIISPPILSEDKILSSPLINLDELKPSFEDIEESSSETLDSEGIKKKKKINQ